MKSVRRYQPPAMSRREAAARTAIARHGRVLRPRHRAGARDSAWALAIELPFDGTGHRQPAASRWLMWKDAAVGLCLHPGAVESWLAAKMPELAANELPAAFVDAVIEALIEDIWALLPEGTPRPVFLSACPDGPQQRQHRWHAVRLSLLGVGTNAQVCTTMLADDTALGNLAAVLAGVRPEADRLPLCGIHVPVGAVVGETFLSVEEIRSLTLGDVVLFDRQAGSGRDESWLVLPGHQRVRARRAANTSSAFLIIDHWISDMTDLSYPPPDAPSFPDELAHTETAGVDPGLGAEGAQPGMESDMEESDAHRAAACSDEQTNRGPSADPAASAAAAGGAPDLRAIPVHLTFDLGHKAVSIAELQELRPGEIFELGRSIEDGPVYVRANGKCIGIADLVDIEGRLGARILALSDGEHPECL